ncbi:MAG: hypothetical protein D3904_15295 [Candidatus Electrothrix sp. EH2]|nr:hypothetical protein [Candidatus Electrothrix sp. EH2]
MGLEELGPTFIKLGQLLSSRPDFISPDFLKSYENFRIMFRLSPIRKYNRFFGRIRGKTLKIFFPIFPRPLWLPPRSAKCILPAFLRMS